MRAVRIDAPGELRCVDVPAREPEPHEVVVDVAYAGICGSDAEIFGGGRPSTFVRYPVVPGHEWAGRISAVGAAVAPTLVDRNVVGEGFTSCHSCAPCRRGEAVLCERRYDEIGFTRPGAWAEQLVIAAEQLHVLGDDADMRSAAGLEPGACAADIALRADIRSGERVAIVGGGTIGLLTVQLLRGAHADALVVVEPNERRARVAGLSGATETVHPANTVDLVDEFDVAIEASGAPTATECCVRLARRGGRLVLAGIPNGTAALDVRDIVTKRLEIRTVFGAPHRAWCAAVDAFNEGRLDPGVLVTHELELDAAAEALSLLVSGDPTAGKILLYPRAMS